MTKQKAKTKVEEAPKVKTKSKNGGKSEYLKDIAMRMADARTHRQKEIRKLRKTTIEF